MTLKDAITIKDILDREYLLKRNAYRSARDEAHSADEQARESKLEADINHAKSLKDIEEHLYEDYCKVDSARDAFILGDWKLG